MKSTEMKVTACTNSKEADRGVARADRHGFADLVALKLRYHHGCDGLRQDKETNTDREASLSIFLCFALCL